MSHPEREAPAVRPRRRVNPPVYLEDFELSGPGSHRQQSRSLTSQGELEDEPASTTGHSRSTSPVSQASEHSQWILTDQWDSITERLREENAALQRQVEQLPELTAMMEEMKRENAALQRQASQLPEIISAVQQMRQQNAALYQELQNLKSERKSPPKPVTPPMPSPRSYSRAVNIQTPQLYRPIPAPRSRLPPPVTKKQPYSAVPEESSELTEDLRNMNISSSSHEKPPFSAQYSDLPQLKYSDRSPYSLPRQLPEFMVPTQDQRRPAYAEYSSDHLLPSSTQEKIYRGPAPTIPCLTSPDPREFSRLRIALENMLPDDVTERFKFQILTDHLKLEEALLVADSYSNSRFPFSNTMKALNKMYGQPHQLALQRIAELMDGANIRSGDVKAFRMFGLQVRSLVSMLQQLGHKGTVELECGSHVSRLLSKLPHDLRSSFKRYTHPLQVTIPTLLDFADWLEYELQVQEDTHQYACHPRQESSVRGREIKRESRQLRKPTTILLGTEKSSSTPT
ncbi:titin [Labeo rohita]|uniref:titin n=1 Tax=Labeo rohita TaxID=84645 RepID=UPI0021E27FB0|nr:titin [Labeo rohita]